MLHTIAALTLLLVFSKMKLNHIIRKKDRLPAENTWKYLQVSGVLGLTISLPLVSAVWIGSIIDQHFGSKPMVTLVLLLVSSVGIVFLVTKLIRSIVEVY